MSVDVRSLAPGDVVLLRCGAFNKRDVRVAVQRLTATRAWVGGDRWISLKTGKMGPVWAWPHTELISVEKAKGFLGELSQALAGEAVEKVAYEVGGVGRLMSWEEFAEVVGAPLDCWPVHVWTATRVLFVAVYDGDHWIQAVPRNPSDEVPEYVGGG